MAGHHDDGPRRWWAGPLDVDGLALGAVRAACTALDYYIGAPGTFTTTPALTAAAFDSSGHLRIAGRKLQGFAPLSGFRRTLDGWIRLHANYPHHEQRLMRALASTSPEGVDATLRTMTSAEAEATVQAQGGIAAAVRTRAQWLASGMGKAAGTGPWVSLATADGGTPALGLPHPGMARDETTKSGTGTAAGFSFSANSARPLQDIRVLDLTRVIAGPVSTRLLAALGADVLRIDPPALPELIDQFVDTGFGKRSAEANLAVPANHPMLRRLLAEADVVITGYRRGTLDRFGLSPAALLASLPRLVVVTLNSWGGEGPWSGLRGFDSIVQAACGIAHLYRKEHDGDWHPGALPVQALDHATGYGAAAAAVTLLTARRRTGLGGTAQLSLARTAEELFRMPKPPRDVGVLPEPEYRTMASTYGELRYVPPPLLVSGKPVDYNNPPPPYGSSALAWARSPRMGD